MASRGKWPSGTSVAQLLAELGLAAGHVAVEVNLQLVPRAQHCRAIVGRGRPGRNRHASRWRIVRCSSGQKWKQTPEPRGRIDGRRSDDGIDAPLRIGSHTLASRLIVGTGKYASYELMAQALALSGTDCITVAVRRERLIDSQGRNLLDSIDRSRYTLLPNTAGCFTADDAVRVARLGREILLGLENPGADWVKLEVLGDTKTLLPDPVATLEATEQLVAEGFQVLCYTSDDPIIARRLKAGRRGERDAGRQPDRLGPGNFESQQHPHLPGISQGRRSRIIR